MQDYVKDMANFFKLNEKVKFRDPAPDPLRVRQVGVEIMEQGSNDKYLEKQGDNLKKLSKRNVKLPHNCFLCANEKLKHFFGDCPKFEKLSVVDKRKKIIEAGKCLNCLSVGHFVCDCELHSKRYKCGSKYKNKHSRALHEFYSRSTSVNLEVQASDYK